MSLEKRITDRAGNDGMSPSAKADGDSVKFLCLLEAEVFEKEFGKLNTDEVVITNERMRHIREHHPMDYALFEEYGKKTVEAPDIIIRDIKKEGTVFMVLRMDSINLNTVVRLSVARTDSPEHKNSVMTFYRIRSKNLTKLLEKHKVLYNRAEE